MTVMRWLLVLPLVALTAHAGPGPKKPASLLATGQEDNDPAPPVVRAAPKPPQTGASEAAVLRGVLWAFEPAPLEVRIQAIEDLGLLGDPRALNPLAQLAIDPNVSLSRAAVRAIGAIRHPRAEEILRNVVHHPAALEPTKALAMELLIYQNTTSALRLVNSVARATNYPGAVLAAARRTAADLPQRRPGALP